MKWKKFVEVLDLDEGAPYYVQWIVWCWRKPIWIGLPIVWLAAPILVVDVIYIISMGLLHWGEDEQDND